VAVTAISRSPAATAPATTSSTSAAPHRFGGDEEVVELADAGSDARDHQEPKQLTAHPDRHARATLRDHLRRDAGQLGVGLEVRRIGLPDERGALVEITQHLAFIRSGVAHLGDQPHAPNDLTETKVGSDRHSRHSWSLTPILAGAAAAIRRSATGGTSSANIP
jgi:hypothetical protein